MWIANPNLSGDKYPSNIHHLYPTSRGGRNIDENKRELYIMLHNNFHWVFGNLTPKEQLLKLMLINKSIWTEEFKNDIYKVLNETQEDYYYQRGIYLHK